jgi:hypothetical protein
LSDSQKPSFICPKNCAGRGRCDYSRAIPNCVCNDPGDLSPFCGNSPRSTAFQPIISNETLNLTNSTLSPSSGQAYNNTTIAPSSGQAYNNTTIAPSSGQAYNNTTIAPSFTLTDGANPNVEDSSTQLFNNNQKSAVASVFQRNILSAIIYFGIELILFS